MIQAEGRIIHNSEKSVSKSHNSVSEKLPLKRILKTIAVSSLFSFLISEVLFLYFLRAGISKFPENLIVCLGVLSIFFGLETLLFSDEILMLTSLTSGVAIVFIVNCLFGSSPNPSILADYLNLEGGDLFLDSISIGLAGPLSWLLFLRGIYGFLSKARKLSIRQAYLSLSANASRIVTFFDKHPWVATVLIGFISLLVGVLIGMLRR